MTVDKGQTANCSDPGDAGGPSRTTATGRLVNGTFALASPLQGLGVVKTWSAPVSNDVVTVPFTQSISATEPLRTGSYSKTLTSRCRLRCRRPSHLAGGSASVGRRRG